MEKVKQTMKISRHKREKELLAQAFFFHIAESNGTAKPFKKEKVLLRFHHLFLTHEHPFVGI